MARAPAPSHNFQRVVIVLPRGMAAEVTTMKQMRRICNRRAYTFPRGGSRAPVGCWLVAGRAQLGDGGVDEGAIDCRAAHADHAALEPGPGGVGVALDRNAGRGQAADHRGEFSAVIAALV